MWECLKKFRSEGDVKDGRKQKWQRREGEGRNGCLPIILTDQPAPIHRRSERERAVSEKTASHADYATSR